tara:strand:- start:4081 stop:4938 length:858 start_codon:yes stop_codon:yes gene_type:complete
MINLNFLKVIIKKLPLIAGLYRYTRDLNLLYSKTKFRKNLGFFFNGLPLMQMGLFEIDETKIFDKTLPFCDILVNIGANTGYYSCRALSKGKKTIAFEPNYLNIRILLKNIEANKFSNDFFLLPIALGDKNGVIPMYGDSTGASLIKGWADQRNSNLVPISIFDNFSSFVESKRCLVVVDIEGSEYSFLKGAKSLLNSENSNIFIMEISVCEHQPSGIKLNPRLLDTFNLMFSNDFNAYTADTKLRKIHIKEIEDICATSIDTLGTHNFIFIKSNLSLKEVGLDN